MASKLDEKRLNDLMYAIEQYKNAVKKNPDEPRFQDELRECYLDLRKHAVESYIAQQRPLVSRTLSENI